MGITRKYATVQGTLKISRHLLRVAGEEHESRVMSHVSTRD